MGQKIRIPLYVNQGEIIFSLAKNTLQATNNLLCIKQPYNSNGPISTVNFIIIFLTRALRQNPGEDSSDFGIGFKLSASINVDAKRTLPNIIADSLTYLQRTEEMKRYLEITSLLDFHSSHSVIEKINQENLFGKSPGELGDSKILFQEKESLSSKEMDYLLLTNEGPPNDKREKAAEGTEFLKIHRGILFSGNVSCCLANDYILDKNKDFRFPISDFRFPINKHSLTPYKQQNLDDYLEEESKEEEKNFTSFPESNNRISGSKVDEKNSKQKEKDDDSNRHKVPNETPKKPTVAPNRGKPGKNPDGISPKGQPKENQDIRTKNKKIKSAISNKLLVSIMISLSFATVLLIFLGLYCFLKSRKKVAPKKREKSLVVNLGMIR